MVSSGVPPSTSASLLGLPLLIVTRSSSSTLVHHNNFTCPRLHLTKYNMAKLGKKLTYTNFSVAHFLCGGFVVRQSLDSYVCSETVSGSDQQQQVKKEDYSVWAIPPDEVVARLKKLMEGLRAEFGGPQFEPHITVVGTISLTTDDALAKFRSACEGLKAYNASVDRVATGTFFYQCVYLLLHPTAEVVEASSHCTGHFGYRSSTPYMPHLSLLYGDLSEDEKKKAQEKATALDDGISSLSFPITRLALYKTDTEDKTLKSWEKIAECSLETK